MRLARRYQLTLPPGSPAPRPTATTIQPMPHLHRPAPRTPGSGTTVPPPHHILVLASSSGAAHRRVEPPGVVYHTELGLETTYAPELRPIGQPAIRLGEWLDEVVGRPPVSLGLITMQRGEPSPEPGPASTGPRPKYSVIARRTPVRIGWGICISTLEPLRRGSVHRIRYHSLFPAVVNIEYSARDGVGEVGGRGREGERTRGRGCEDGEFEGGGSYTES